MVNIALVCYLVIERLSKHLNDNGPIIWSFMIFFSPFIFIKKVHYKILIERTFSNLKIKKIVFLTAENEDKKLWDPSSLSQQSVEEYLAKSEESLHATGVTSLPLGSHIRDDEQVRT